MSTGKAIQALLTAAAALLLIILGAAIQKGLQKTGPVPIQELKPDTLYIHDTTRIPDPVPVYKTVTRLDTIYMAESGITALPEAAPEDSVTAYRPDSLVVPIETTVYKTEDYRAVVEGYRARLTELEIYGTSLQITKPVVLQSSKWGVGVTAGVAVTKDGWAPAVTLGVTYNIYQAKRR